MQAVIIIPMLNYTCVMNYTVSATNLKACFVVRFLSVLYAKDLYSPFSLCLALLQLLNDSEQNFDGLLAGADEVLHGLELCFDISIPG